ncbi:MAG: amidohydrolase family protein [Myxococcota bacterium]
MLKRTLTGLVALGAAMFITVACGDDTAEDDDGPGGSGGTGAAGGSGGTGGAGGTGGTGGTGGGGDEEVEIITCTGAPPADPGGDVCAVTAGDDRRLVVGDVLQPGRVFEGGAVLIDAAGTITCAGCDCFDEGAGATVIACPDAVVSPGLIDAHDHVGWMNGRPWVASENGVDPEERWEHRNDWRRGRRGNSEIDVDGGGASRDEKTLGELRFALSGATGKFGSGDMGGFLRDLDSTGDGDNGLGEKPARYETFPLGDTSGTQQADGCTSYSIREPVAAFFDAHAPHVAEGIDDVAQNEFACLTGQGAGSEVYLDARAALIHGIGLGPIEIGQMAAQGMRLVWSPRSNIALYGNTAPITVYDAMGVSIGLGTDWIPSGSMNMLRELQCAASFNRDYLGGYFSDHRLWQMATIGSARALAFDDATGILIPDRAGDIAIYANNGARHYGAVVSARVEDVALVLKGGAPLTGNQAVVDALETGCDTLDVCGVTKGVCLEPQTGSTLAQLESAADMQYPLFACGPPQEEPSCVPARTLGEDQVDGSTLYAGMSSADDPDADGVPDAMDNCPGVFNPVRPVDAGVQGDADSDGTGDACDRCPLDADTDTCDAADPNDIDGDGTPNTTDNCPGIANADQADADNDGKGDECDACPDAANPGAEACPATIYAIQDVTDPNHVPEGTEVEIACVVTAIADNKFWCQDPLGGPFSGISIFTGSAPAYDDSSALQLYDSITVAGTYVEFFDLTQLSDATVTYVGPGTAPTPELVVSSAIATGGALAESYEGVLVRIVGVEVTIMDPDPMDFDEFVVTGNLRIDDDIFEALDNTFPVMTAFAEIVGIHHFSFSNYKLLPRSAADLVQ